MEQVLRGVERVVVIGGDGTFASTAAAARLLDVPAALIPCGTGNAVATALNLTPERTLDLLAAGAVPRPIDLLDAGSSTATFCVGIGMDAAAAVEVSRAGLRHWGKAAYLQALWNARRRYLSWPMKVVLDGNLVFEGYLWECLVMNAANIGASITIAPDARPDDGLLHLRVFEGLAPSLFKITAVATNAARTGKDIGLGSLYSGRSVEVSSDRRFPVEFDGEPSAPREHLNVTLTPAALRVYY